MIFNCTDLFECLQRAWRHNRIHYASEASPFPGRLQARARPSHQRMALRLAGNQTPAGVQNFEMTIELNYGWMVRPGLLLQPDLQYLVHPNGNTRLRNAVAIGINIVLNL